MSEKLIDERPILFLPSLAIELGSVERAIVLQQIFWLWKLPGSGIEKHGHHWVWSSYKEWCENYFLMWKPDTLRKHVNWLEKAGYLVSVQGLRGPWDSTKSYRVVVARIGSEDDATPPEDDAGLVTDSSSDSSPDSSPEREREEHDTSKYDGNCGPPPSSFPVTPAKPTKRRGKVTRYDMSKIGANGLVPRGEGDNAIEVWLEYYTKPPTVAQMDEITEYGPITDLKKWRAHVHECAIGKSFKNFGPVLETYRNGFKEWSNGNNGKLSTRTGGRIIDQAKSEPNGRSSANNGKPERPDDCADAIWTRWSDRAKRDYIAADAGERADMRATVEYIIANVLAVQ